MSVILETTVTLNAGSATVTVYEDLQKAKPTGTPVVEAMAVDTAVPELVATIQPNGGTVKVVVNEDTDNDGTAENTETVFVQGSGQTTHELTSITGGSGNDYWLDLSLDPDQQSSESQSVADGTNTYTLSTLTGGSGNEYWVELSLDDTDVTASPVVQSVSVNTNPAVTDSGTITTATGSSLTSSDVAALTEQAGVLAAAATTLSPAEIAEATAAGSIVNAVATVLSAAEVTEALPGTSVTDGSAATLSAAEVAEAVESGLVTATATPLTPSETATLSETPGVKTAAATTLSPDEFPVTTESGVVTAAVATPLSASEAVEDVIAGTVTLSGSGVQGAKVYVIDTDGDTVAGTATTDVNGDYSVTVPADPPYHIAVQYDDGSQKYNALSKPFVE